MVSVEEIVPTTLGLRILASAGSRWNDCTHRTSCTCFAKLQGRGWCGGGYDDWMDGTSIQPEAHLCVLVRHDPAIPTATFLAFLYSLLAQTFNSLDIFIKNTRAIREEHHAALAMIPKDERIHQRWGVICKENTFGYCELDQLLEYALQEYKQCTHFLFTNSDNLYNVEFARTMMTKFEKETVMVVSNFVTHHLRRGRKKQRLGNMHVRAAFRRRYMDLGSVIVAKWAIESTGARFLPSEDPLAADWLFYKKLTSSTSAQLEEAVFLEETLFFHQ